MDQYGPRSVDFGVQVDNRSPSNTLWSPNQSHDLETWVQGDLVEGRRDSAIKTSERRELPPAQSPGRLWKLVRGQYLRPAQAVDVLGVGRHFRSLRGYRGLANATRAA